MDQTMLSKGKKLLWTGFTISLVFNLLGYLASPDANLMPSLQSLSPIMNLLAFVGLILMVIGSLKILKAKNRHWAYVFLLIFNLVGILIIVFLRDKPQATISTTLESNNGSGQ